MAAAAAGIAVAHAARVTLEMALVLGIIAAALVLFVLEVWPPEMVAMMGMIALLVSGVLTPEEGLAGFGNTATVVVGSMFVVSAALRLTGAVDSMARRFTAALHAGYRRGLVVLILGVAPLSAFMNNTAVVAIFLPLVILACRDARVSSSRLLIPLSYASILGGSCTLIGTSTTLVVRDVAVANGAEPIRMFEMAPVGLVFWLAGTAYLLLLGRRLLPDRRSDDAGPDQAFVTEVRVAPDSPHVGKRVESIPPLARLRPGAARMVRGPRVVTCPEGVPLAPHDVVLVEADKQDIQKLSLAAGLESAPGEHPDTGNDDVVAEAVVAPNSRLASRSLKSVRFEQVYGLRVLGIRHRQGLFDRSLQKTELAAGDVLLLSGPPERIERLRRDPSFVMVSQLGSGVRRRHHMWLAIGITGAAVALAALEILPVAVAMLAAAALLVLSRCVTFDEAYQAIEWRVVFLLAGAMSFGIALEKTGAAALVAELVAGGLGPLGPVAVLSGVYLLTSVLTEVMSNAASAALLTPIAMATAQALGVDDRAFIMAVVFGASASFMTPVGYQTNLLVYGAGRYSFGDFLRIGVPLNLLLWILATLLLPIMWPL